MNTGRILRVSTATAACAAAALLVPGVANAATERAHWSMNDTGTSMADSSGNSNTGKLKNVTTGDPGLSGTSFGFAQKPSYVNVPDNSSLDPDTSDFTITLHVKFTQNPPSSVGDYDLLRKGLSTTSGGSYKVEIYNNKALCNFRGAKQGQVNSGPSLNDGKWHTIVCARTSSKVTLTVDGSSWSKSVSTGKISNSSSLMIGAKNTSGADQYNGFMDEVVIS